MRATAFLGSTYRWLFGSLLAANLVSGIAILAQAPQTPVELVNTMTARERDAASHRDHYAYLSNERSDRTGGHLWTERVVETPAGHVRFLLAEDGQPVPPERLAAERAKLAEIVAHPDEFARQELAHKNDELRARDMLSRLPKGFVLENVRLNNNVWTLNYHPDPAYSPSGVEDKVLHNMSGSFSIDAHDFRLIHLDGHTNGDVSFGLGLLATLRAGSSFAMDKSDIQGTWRAVHVATDFKGKAILFKTIARSTNFTRSEFQRLDPNMTLAQAVDLAQAHSSVQVAENLATIAKH